MRDGRTNEQLKIELLSQWKLEAEFRKNRYLQMIYLQPQAVQVDKLDKVHLHFNFMIRETLEDYG